MVENTVKKTVELFAAVGIDITMQQGFHIIEFLLFFVACIAIFVSCSIVTGSNVLFGQPYGKTKKAKAILKYLSLLMFILLFLILVVFYIVDIVSIFFDHKGIIELILFFITPIAGIFVVFKCTKWGEIVAERAAEKRDELYKDEVNAILMNNPVFVEALNKIKNDANIKMVKIFRDGISFHATATPPQKETRKILGGATTNNEAGNLLKKEKEDILKSIGTVLSSYSGISLRYSDYGFSSSETAMSDLSKWLFKYLEPRFIRGAHEIVLDYHDYISSGPTGYVVHNNQVTPTGGSGKSISAFESFVVSEILYTASKEEPKQYKKW
ncbi:MAG: hypothetical protein J6M34_07535 [Clostridia bacterium]|nr:hypothetical protein [Clostridia bacterium]